VAVVLIVGLTIWCLVDVRRRGEIIPGRIESHSTDFTVYTTAGAAFFDGRDPYRVTSPRGWYYLYPPIFALLVSPLAGLDSKSQVVVWFIVSVALAFGCYAESRRLWRLLVACDAAQYGASFVHCKWTLPIGILVGFTVLFPALECLQRGQLGIALLYPLLLGFRLALFGRTWRIRCLGGIVLAWPVVVKLIPALPVGFLLGQFWFATLARGWSPRSAGRAAAASLGVALGVFVFGLGLPAACIGWGRNLHHLSTWAQKVVLNADAGREAKVDIDTTSNQSLSNAAHQLAARVRSAALEPLSVSAIEEKGDPSRWMAAVLARAEGRRADQVIHRAVRALQSIVLALLIVTGSAMARRGDFLGQAATYGLACLAVVLVSPVAWTHYFVLGLPAVMFVPLWLVRQGHPIAAGVTAVNPAVLSWAHYLAKPWTGTLGLLGLGTTAWCLAVLVLFSLATFSVRPAPQRRSRGGLSTDLWTSSVPGSAPAAGLRSR
jgi:hypothetical protein